MHKIAILGAGYMGGAMTFPLAENNLSVNLWGTWLDNEIIDSCQKGIHPKLKKALPDSVNLYYSRDLKKAIEDVDIIFIGVSSDGFLPVFSKVIEVIDKNYFFFTLTKGFVNDNGKIQRISKIASKLFYNKFAKEEFNWSSIGGPVKALEISKNIPTVSIYGTKNKEMENMTELFSTESYRIVTTDDVIGVELCSAFKNVYSMAMGMLDGIYKPSQEGMYHNFSSLIFNQGIIEISKIVGSAGGNRETVTNFAGIGDLYTTSQSGRNRLFGELLGKGVSPNAAYRKMLSSGELAEGYFTLKHSMEWLASLNSGILYDLPLFKIIYDIILNNKKPLEELKGLSQIYKK